MLLKFLKSKFGPGKPIFTEDAESLGLSAGNLRQQFKKLVDAGELSRFEPGVYFLPDPNHEYYPISSNMVAEYKYINRLFNIFVIFVFLEDTYIVYKIRFCHLINTTRLQFLYLTFLCELKF